MSLILLFTFPRPLPAAEPPAFTDPAPPTVAVLAPRAAAEPQANPDATFHAAPKPLARDAVTSDWVAFLGPNHNGVSPETKLLARFPKGGPALVWEVNKGSGYSAPAILGDRLVLLHRVEGDEVVDCLKADTGQRYWRLTYPSNYMDRYGYCDGPRASPVIALGKNADDSLVYTVGAEGTLHCIELSTGRVLWARDLLKEFGLTQNFFGVGSTPLVEGNNLIVNVGAPHAPCVAAFDLKTGRMAWGASSGEPAWGPSYASPIPAVVNGKRRVFVFAGGETGPHQQPTGGLLCVDPDNGKVDFTLPWRSKRRESVNASSPLVLADPAGHGAQVLISECYGTGGTLLDIGASFSCKPAWSNENFGTHFMTAVEKDGYLYGVDGHGPNDAFLVCVERNTGKEVWRKQPEWDESGPDGQGGSRTSTWGLYRCQLMPVDGRCLCLGEFGHLLWLDLEPTGYKELDRARLFNASETWTGPVLSRGLLYINQNAKDAEEKHGPRLLCYDLRG
jgi:outer membrane protein assembly factor BamB